MADKNKRFRRSKYKFDMSKLEPPKKTAPEMEVPEMEVPEVTTESAPSVTEDDSLEKILSELKRQKIRRARQLMSKAKNKRNNQPKKPRKRNGRKNHIAPLPATHPREKKYKQKSISEKLRDKLKQAMETLGKAKESLTEKLSEKAESFKNFFSNDKDEEADEAPEATAPEAMNTLPDLSDDKTDITRFSMYSPQLTDKNGNPSYTHLKDWSKQVKQMQKALESATGKAVRVFNNIDREGNAVATFDVGKEMEKIAEASFDSTLSNIETRYEYPEYSMTRDPYVNKVKKEHLYSGDIDDEEERQREEKEEKTSKRKMLHTITLIVSVLTAIADITRRILTATLARASEIKKESLDAKSLGITYVNMREYKAQETAMGMKEGTFASAIGALQSATGDISNLDTNVIKELAKVMQGDVIEAINNGLGRSDPEKLMGMILDTYYKRGQSGINSLGQQVGKYQAERELATALEKAGLGDLAEILRNMFYTNDTGIYKGRVGRETPFEDYMKLVVAYTAGLTPTDYKKASELGAVVDSLKKTFNNLKENLETKLLNSLGGLIDKINSWQIGMSAEERVMTNEEKTQLNKQQIEHMQKLTEQTKPQVEKAFKDAGIDFSALGVKGVTSAETYVKWRQDWRARNWEPKTDKAKETAQKIGQFLLTEQGKEAVRLIALSETAQELEQQAQKDLRQSAKTGTVEYQATSYTDSGIASKARDRIMQLRGITLPLDKDKVGVGVYTPEAVLGAVSALLGGFNYARALDSQSSKRLTEDLADKAEQRWTGRVPFSKRGKAEASWRDKTKGLSKEEQVKWALATGILTEKDVRDITMKALEFGYTPDYGISPEVFDKAREAVRQKEEKETLDTASRQLIVSEALKQSAGTAEAQELFRQRQAESKVYTQIVSYDDKKGLATVRVELDVTGNGQKVGHFDKTIQTDAQSNATAVFQQRMDMTGNPALENLTRESMTNGSTR